MTRRESVDLVLSALTLARSGEIFIPKMHAMRLIDLAQAMCEVLAPGKSIARKEIGLRSGEKLYEELFSPHELPRCLETQRMFILQPYLEEAEIESAKSGGQNGAEYPIACAPAVQTYSSEKVQPMTPAAVLELLRVELPLM